MSYIYERPAGLTVAFNHEGFNDIVSDHLEIGVANPVTDSSLRTGEKVVKNSDFMTEKHETVNKMGSDESSTAGDENALALRRRQKLDRREARKCGVRDRIGVWVVNRF